MESSSNPNPSLSHNEQSPKNESSNHKDQKDEDHEMSRDDQSSNPASEKDLNDDESPKKEGSKPICPKCSKSFCNGSNLSRHMKKVHTEEKKKSGAKKVDPF
jgi:uncharacterized Zn-finger protein